MIGPRASERIAFSAPHDVRSASPRDPPRRIQMIRVDIEDAQPARLDPNRRNGDVPDPNHLLDKVAGAIVLADQMASSVVCEIGRSTRVGLFDPLSKSIVNVRRCAGAVVDQVDSAGIVVGKIIAREG